MSTNEIALNKFKQLYALFTVYGIIHALPGISRENTDRHGLVLVLLYRKEQ